MKYYLDLRRYIIDEKELKEIYNIILDNTELDLTGKQLLSISGTERNESLYQKYMIKIIFEIGLDLSFIDDNTEGGLGSIIKNLNLMPSGASNGDIGIEEKEQIKTNLKSFISKKLKTNKLKYTNSIEDITYLIGIGALEKKFLINEISTIKSSLEEKLTEIKASNTDLDFLDFASKETIEKQISDHNNTGIINKYITTINNDNTPNICYNGAYSSSFNEFNTNKSYYDSELIKINNSLSENVDKNISTVELLEKKDLIIERNTVMANKINGISDGTDIKKIDFTYSNNFKTKIETYNQQNLQDEIELFDRAEFDFDNQKFYLGSQEFKTNISISVLLIGEIKVFLTAASVFGNDIILTGEAIGKIQNVPNTKIDMIKLLGVLSEGKNYSETKDVDGKEVNISFNKM